MSDEALRAPRAARTFTVSRRKWLGVLALSAVFVAGGSLLIVVERSVVVGWLTVALFGIGLIVAVLQVIAPGRLVVSETTIEVVHMGRRWTRDLARCGAFETWRNPFARQSLVVFDHPEDAVRKLPRVSRGVSGRSSSLPDTYGYTAPELARILNEARATALSGAHDADT